MTNEAWESLSNQAVAAAGVVYFLSLLAYLVQWASLRKVPADRTAEVAVPAGAVGLDTSLDPRDGTTSDSTRSQRI